MPKFLVVANVAKEHIIKFHLPTIRRLKDEGWHVSVASNGDQEIPFCDEQIDLPCARSPFRLGTLRSIRQLRSKIRNGDFEIMHCHTPTGGLIARLATVGLRHKRPTVVYTAHGFRFHKGAPVSDWLIYMPAEWVLARFTDCTIVINDEDYRNAKGLLRSKNLKRINGVGVDLTRFEPGRIANNRETVRASLGIPSDALSLIYVAELIENKNQGDLLRMMKMLLADVPDSHLLLVGPDHHKGTFQKLAADLGVSDAVHFLGWRHDVPDLMNASDYAVASSFTEGLPINLVEAMAACLPVIAFENRGHCQVLTDGWNGVLVDHGRSDLIAQAVVELENDSGRRESMVRNGVQTVSEFAEASVLDELFKIYRELERSGPSPINT